jgi:hypothetical protein
MHIEEGVAMKNKYVVMVCVMLVMLGVTSTVFAADMLHRLTHGDQDALALGTIADIAGERVNLEVETVIAGKLLPACVSVDGVLSSSFSSWDLQVGDYVVMSINQSSGGYTVAWGIYQVTSLDLNSLDVVAGPLGPGDLAAFQWYINSGGVENDFYFVEGEAYVRHPDGTSQQIYPREAQPASSAIAVRGGQSLGDAVGLYALLVLCGAVLIGGVCVVIWNRERARRF